MPGRAPGLFGIRGPVVGLPGRPGRRSGLPGILGPFVRTGPLKPSSERSDVDSESDLSELAGRSSGSGDESLASGKGEAVSVKG